MRLLSLLVRKSLAQHALSSVVTALATALAAGLVVSVFSLSAQARRAFIAGDPGFDAVVGGRGSELQIVLNAVYHLETSPGTVPWSLYEELIVDPRVQLAVPYAVGDSYRGYRIVGTTPERFEAVVAPDGRPFELVRGERYFDATLREAVIGAVVARELQMGVGARFQPSHGLSDLQRHDEEYVVVGVLRPTSSPLDRVIWIPIEGVLRMSGHVLRDPDGEQDDEAYEPSPDEPIPDELRQVSAVMLKLSESSAAGFQLAEDINRRGREATLAWPIAKSVGQLFDRLGWVTSILSLVASLTVVVAAGAILASLTNAMNERRRELAVLRALGARRTTLLAAIVGEAAAIALMGAVVGLGVHLGIMAIAAEVVWRQTGVAIEVAAWHPAQALTPLSVTLLGALAGLIPAARAYRTEVADELTPA